MQPVDRTTKLLLGAIALALWIGLIRSVFAPVPAEAQRTTQDVNIQSVGGLPVDRARGLPIEGASEQRPVIVRQARIAQ